MAEWSKAPDSRCTPCFAIQSKLVRILVLDEGMGSNPISDKNLFFNVQKKGGCDGEVFFRFVCLHCHARGYSSVVEHPAAVRQVLGSTPSVPLILNFAKLHPQPYA